MYQPPRSMKRAHVEKGAKPLAKNLADTIVSRLKKSPTVQSGVPISVNMIVKNCAGQLARCLQSVTQKFMRTGDELVIVDTGSTDNTIEVARSFGAKVIERPDLRVDVTPYLEKWIPEWREKWESQEQFSKGCILDFAGARQIAAEASANDALFWIDSDDVFSEEVEGAFRAMVDQCWGQADAFFMDYYYSFDPQDHRCTTVLKRERVVDRRNYHWVGRCHETLIPKPGVTPRGAIYNPQWKGGILHLEGRTDHTFSDMRNYIIIRKEIEEGLAKGEEPDVRSIFYMGNAARGLKKNSEALSMYAKTLQLSGSPDDRYSAAYYSAITSLDPSMADPMGAEDWAYKCMQIKPDDPRAFYLLSRICSLTERHEESLRWYRLGRTLPEPKHTLHSYDPEHIKSLPVAVALYSAKELGRGDEVQKLMDELLAVRDTPEVRKGLEEYANWLRAQKLVESVFCLAQNRARTATDNDKIRNEARTLVSALPAVPEELERAGVGKLEGFDPREPTDRSIAILCSNTHEAWGPKTDGIGGSERMIRIMAPALQRRDINVTVYANVPRDQRAVDKDGVLWRHFSEYDENRPRDIVIVWRGVGLAAQLQGARRPKKLVFWGHDVQDPRNWTDQMIDAYDEIWLLSRYHASTLGPKVLERIGQKLWITRNALDDRLWANADKIQVERKPNRVVYCSSPDRGVLTAIRAFQTAFRGDKDAELHIGYGFTKMFWSVAADFPYRHVPDLNRTISYYDYVRLVRIAVQQDPRITFHGRVGWSDMIVMMRSAGIWLYPTRFPEISCMSAMEAQAAGMKIVATQTAALAETIDWTEPGVLPCQPENAGDALAVAHDLDVTQDQIESKAKRARIRFSSEALADEWSKRLTT